jgi:hypothetical protein
LSPAAALSRDDAGLQAAAVITPPLFFWSGMPTLSFLKPKRRRILAKKARQLPRRAAYRIRYGAARALFYEQAEPGDPAADLEDLVAATPTWIFAGSEDFCVKPVEELLPRLQERGTVELELADNLAVYGGPSPIAQSALDNHVRAWVRRCMTTADASA